MTDVNIYTDEIVMYTFMKIWDLGTWGLCTFWESNIYINEINIYNDEIFKYTLMKKLGHYGLGDVGIICRYLYI